MLFSREIKRVLFGLLIAFGLVGLTTTYWAVVGPDTIMTREDNPRQIEAILRIQRGSIYDRDDHLLVESADDNGDHIRNYLEESTYSPIGYYSVRYGEGGVEAAFNDDLNGETDIDDIETYFERHILNVSPVGADIRLTLDLEIQNSLVDSIGGLRGTGVVMNAQSGAILALASLPTFNPNTLDEEWDTLTEDEGKPFFNRALQGQYQPGSVMYTLWLAHAVLSGYNLSAPIADATLPIPLGDNTNVDCIIIPSSENLSLEQAYQSGCPMPFIKYEQRLSDSIYDELVKNFRLNNQITLNNFPIPEPISPTSGTQASIEVEPSIQVLRDTLGQGDITVTPLHVTGIMSAIANNGNTPQPRILHSTRPVDSEVWLPNLASQPSIPMMTSTTARQLRTIMQTNWQSIQTETYPTSVMVGANIATSQSGDETQLWIIGFVRTEQAGYVAFAVLLEDTNDIQNIIRIGQVLIQTLIDELTLE